MIRTIAMLCMGLALSTGALAADNGVYLGVGIAKSDVEFEGASGFQFDGDDTNFKAIIGVRPLDWLAFEANYVDFGTIETPAGTPSAFQSELELKGFDAFAIGLIEVGVVDFFAKAGVVSWNATLDYVSNIANVDDDGFDLAYGAGIGAHFGSLGVRGEYEMFDIEGIDVGMVSLSVTWTFL
jgi:hypothetical protein